MNMAPGIDQPRQRRVDRGVESDQPAQDIGNSAIFMKVQVRESTIQKNVAAPQHWRPLRVIPGVAMVME